MNIGYLGDSRSHTYAAAQALMRQETQETYDECGYDTVFDVADAVAAGKVTFGVVPIENSVEGTVAATVDALGQYDLYIVREIVLPVCQSLIAKTGVALQDIDTVYSHPQALAQCRNNLRKLLPHASTRSVAFTSAGLSLLDGHSAAIARQADEGQSVLIEDFADSKDNCTRFALVAASPRKTGEKVSVLFSARNEAGALYRALGCMANRNLNMTKIESRPAKKQMGQYVFYVDFLFDGDERARQDFFAELREHTEEIRYLGRYAPYRAG